MRVLILIMVSAFALTGCGEYYTKVSPNQVVVVDTGAGIGTVDKNNIAQACGSRGYVSYKLFRTGYAGHANGGAVVTCR